MSAKKIPDAFVPTPFFTKPDERVKAIREMTRIGGLEVSQDVLDLNRDALTGVAPVEKPRKYLNTPTIYAGRQYDSVKEATRARDLDLRKQAGEIVAWFPHVSFDLPGNSRYEADFVVIDKAWQVHVEDTKSDPTKTPVYRLKRKLFRERYGQDIEEL